MTLPAWMCQAAAWCIVVLGGLTFFAGVLFMAERLLGFYLKQAKLWIAFLEWAAYVRRKKKDLSRSGIE